MKHSSLLPTTYECAVHSDNSIGLACGISVAILDELSLFSSMLEYEVINVLMVKSVNHKEMLKITCDRSRKFSSLEYQQGEFRIALSLEALQYLLSFSLLSLRNRCVYPSHIDIELDASTTQWASGTLIFIDSE